MDSPVENILQHLFQTDSLQNVSVEQIQLVINNHPYYDAAYFLMAKKMQSSDKSTYNSAIQKAALHFSNTAWLHFNLQDDNEAVTATQHTTTEETIKQEETDSDTIEKIPAKSKALSIAEILSENETSTENITDDIISEPEEPIINREDDFVEEALDESSIEKTDDALSEKLSNILREQATAFEKPVEASTEIPLENTPYHRVDYFDSQGIKLQESAADDKLGTQLKRFTDWLKQMKRTNPNQVDLAGDEAGETQVQNIARHSNEPEEIVTETMAEVLIKQGKPEQAIQIYEKLSFNNPSKTAYFAAKIKELKG